MNSNNINPVLSVIIPVYNTEEYLEKCLSSLVASTFKNLEFIIIDDGSTDNSPAICDEFHKNNPDRNITVIHKANEGLSAVRNLGLTIARGKYITYCDSDDWVEPELFEALVSAAEKNDVQAAICGIKYYDNSAKIFKYYTDSLFPEYLTGKTFNYQTCGAIVQGLLDCSTCNKIFLRSFIYQNKFNFDEKYHFAEDSLYWTEYFLAAERLTLIKGRFYNYRINQVRQTNCVKNRKSYDSLANILSNIKEIFERYKAYDKFSGEFLAYLALQVTTAYCNISSTRKRAFYAECRNLYKTCKKFKFSLESSFAIRLLSLYVYVTFKFLPFVLGNCVIFPLLIMKSNFLKKFFRRFVG